MTSANLSDLAPLHRSRLAVAAAFATQGMVFISLTTRLPDFSDSYDLSNGELSVLLLMMVLLAGAGSVLAEFRAKKQPSARQLRIGLAAITVGAALIGASWSLPMFVGAMAVYGVGLGMVDASTNMQAVALEHHYARPILPSFHGAWTLGGLTGAAVALATGSLPVGVVGLVAVVPLAVRFAPFLAGVGDPVHDTAPPVIPWRPIILVGIGMVLFYMVDTAAFTWGPLFLKNVFDDAPSGLFALAVFPYLLSSGGMRLAGDHLVARFGAVLILRIGGVVASGALAVVVFAPAWPVAVLGFLILGTGVGVIAPLSFSAAARIALRDGRSATSSGTTLRDGRSATSSGTTLRDGRSATSSGTTGGAAEDAASRQHRVDAVIARFNQFNYVGALLGSVLTGAVGEHDLRVGFAVPMVLILGILPLARAFAPRPPAVEPVELP